MLHGLRYLVICVYFILGSLQSGADANGFGPHCFSVACFQDCCFSSFVSNEIHLFIKRKKKLGSLGYQRLQLMLMLARKIILVGVVMSG